jgi:hypothetical protein
MHSGSLPLMATQNDAPVEADSGRPATSLILLKEPSGERSERLPPYIMLVFCP